MNVDTGTDTILHVSTTGSDAAGVVAQSIGGGGGKGAIASSTASGHGATTLSASLGGAGGGGSHGGRVEASLKTNIRTQGDASDGVLLQSIGGGGGNAALANSTATGSSSDIHASLTLGGSAGSGSHGDAVSLDQSGQVSTFGAQANGIVLQSIGGGGGRASTVNAKSGGGSFSGSVALGASGGAGGDGGRVTANVNGTVFTYGENAVALLAQSVGGGGGIGASASSDGQGTASLAVTLGASGGAGGNGGDVSITIGAAAQLVSQGTNSHAAVLQSIGGGGGTAGTEKANGTLGVTFGGGSGYAGGSDGGAVTAQVNGLLQTGADGASALLVQSIGGGGGLAGSAARTAFSVSSAAVASGGGDGSGGAITVTLGAGSTATTTGENAAALNLQSIGGGGGQVETGTGVAIGTAGGAGSGGAITAIIGGTVSATGFNAPGLFAISAGGSGVGDIAITVEGTGSLIGGKGPAGAGIMVAGGAQNTILVQAGGLVTGLSGIAILAGSGNEQLTNDGTITGSVDLGTGVDSFTNEAGGVFNSGARVNSGALMVNAGTLNPGGRGVTSATAFTAAFTSTGTYQVDLDALSGASDQLNIAGTALLGGTVFAMPSSIAPNTSFTILTAQSVTNTAQTQDVSIPYSWAMTTTPTTVSVSPNAQFLAPGVPLTQNQAALANHLQQIWDAGGTSGMVPVFSSLIGATTAAIYQQDLNNLSPQALQSSVASRTVDSRAFLNRTLSCPVFIADSTQLHEDQCAWARVILGRTSQSSSADTPGFTADSVTFHAGFQRELATDWFFAASAAYSQANVSGAGGLYQADADGVDVGIAVKRQVGDWLFSAALDLGWVSYDNTRIVPGIGAPTSSSQVMNATARLRASYEFAFASWYMRPMVDVDYVYVNIPSFTEQGSSGAEMQMNAASQGTFVLTPAVEFGGRWNLPDGTVLRPYLTLGASFASNDSWTSTSAFVAAPQGTPSFSVTTPMPSVLGNLDLGVQALTKDNLEIKLEYGLSVGNDYTAQIGMARFAVHF